VTARSPALRRAQDTSSGGRPCAERRLRSTTVIWPLVSIVATCTSCAFRQPAARSAACTSSSVRRSLRIAARSIRPSRISARGVPSSRRARRGLLQASCEISRWQPISVSAEMRPPTSELSPAFIEFCTALERISSSTRSKGSYCPMLRRPVRRRNTSRKT